LCIARFAFSGCVSLSSMCFPSSSITVRFASAFWLCLTFVDVLSLTR
jgi:hypothetical protein